MEGRKEVFYLMMHSTHLDMVIWKEGSVLFNNTLNTFRYGYMEGRKEMLLFNDALNTFSYGYMTSDINYGQGPFR